MTSNLYRGAIRPPGFILAGGLSSRMGTPKALVRLGGVTLLERVATRLSPQVSRLHLNWNGDVPPSGLAGFEPISDETGGHAGPLAGILAAMRHVARVYPETSHVVTVPIDAPFFPLDLVASLEAGLKSADDIAIAFSRDVMHPVFGLWPVSITDDLADFLMRDEKRRVRSFIERHTMRRIDFPIGDAAGEVLDPFVNVNTPQELGDVEQMLVGERKAAP
jgi:molybdopterin-guanine dinucleotide biosynthesis protein A